VESFSKLIKIFFQIIIFVYIFGAHTDQGLIATKEGSIYALHYIIVRYWGLNHENAIKLYEKSCDNSLRT